MQDLKEILEVHSSAAKAVMTAMRKQGMPDTANISKAIAHLNKLRQLIEQCDPSKLPDRPALTEKIDSAIKRLEDTNLPEGREAILAIGRMFDTFLQK